MNSEWQTCKHFRAKHNNICTIFIKNLVENLNPAAAVHSEDGKSALHAAASKGHLDILVILVYKVFLVTLLHLLADMSVG